MKTNPLLGLAATIAFVFFSNYTVIARADNLIIARDSLSKVLATDTAPKERLDILTNLADVSMALNNDKSAWVALWHESIRQHAADATVNAGRSLTLEYLNRGLLDSADIWLAACRKQFSGPLREPVLKYLQLMRDIRNMGDQAAMARKLINEQLNIKNNEDPYDRMVILYKLGTLALTEWDHNEKIEMKSWYSYFEEGYRVACTLPFLESFDFRHQFLVGLCFVSLDYVQQVIQLNKKYWALPQMKNRPFRSHRSDILACTHMFGKGPELGRKEADKWFREFCDLTRRYPYDCQAPYDYYFYAQSIPYYRFTNDKEKIVMCCDSVIANAPKYKLSNSWHYELRGATLAEMGRWREAFENSVTWIAVKDSLANVSSANRLMELQTQYDVDKLHYETQVNRQRFIFSVVGCALLALLLGLLYIHFCTLARKNRNLVQHIREQEAYESRVEANNDTIPEESLSPEEQLYRRIQRLLEDKTLLRSSKLRREELAELLGTNATYVANAIRACTNGLNVSEYINRKRVKYARQLFETQPGSTIDQVCDQCGFSSRSRFHSSFKEYYSITPGEFRKAIKS